MNGMISVLRYFLLLILVTVLAVLKYQDWRTDSSTPVSTPYDDTQIQYYEFRNRTQVRLWIDIPNILPGNYWRECLTIEEGLAQTQPCQLTWGNQELSIFPDLQDRRKIRIKQEIKCLEPVASRREVGLASCSSGYWRWTKGGLLAWSRTGLCMSSGDSWGKGDYLGGI